MFEIISGGADDVLAVRGKGCVTAEDCRDTLIPEAVRRVERHGSLQLLCCLGPEFDGVTPGALWADTRLGLRHRGGVGRMAVDTDVEWIAEAVRLFAPLFHRPVQGFSDAQFDAARKWIVAPEAAVA
jgi:hypothetical protein